MSKPLVFTFVGADKPGLVEKLSQTVAESAASHFGSLAQTVFMPGEGRTLEDVVKDLLRPLLKEWLDTHLSAIVEAKVQSEVERISRRRVY